MSLSEILAICLFSSILGTFIDSFLGSVLEESWWCASKKRVLSSFSSKNRCCLVALKDGERVAGHDPEHCGLVCGHAVCSGNEVNLLSSSIISLCVFFFKGSVVWGFAVCEIHDCFIGSFLNHEEAIVEL